MPEANATFDVRKVDPVISVIDIKGEMTGAADTALMDAYTEASGPQTRAIALNFGGLEYMNSSGIGLLVTLLIRLQRQGQRLLSFGLSDPYRHIFDLTRLNDAIGVYDTEAEALAAAKAA